MNKPIFLSTKDDIKEVKKSAFSPPQIKLRVGADGKMTLPKSLLERIGVTTESEFLVKEDKFIPTLFLQNRVRKKDL